MPSARDIRRRIRSVKNIQQITKAMKMVAAARLRRAQERAVSSRPYTEKIRHILASVAKSFADREMVHPLLAVREPQRIGYIIISADKGLCGAYNSNLIREALRWVKDRPEAGLITIGRKGRDYFRRRGYDIVREMIGFSEKPTYSHARTIARMAAEMYVNGVFDEIYLVYTRFYSPVSHKPTTVKLLPITAEETDWQPASAREYIFEPSADTVLDLLLPKYLETVIYGALLQASASELGARMAAMGNATDNAKELIAKLTLSYNKVRQATITKELLEIVSGADALK